MPMLGIESVFTSIIESHLIKDYVLAVADICAINRKDVIGQVSLIGQVSH